MSSTSPARLPRFPRALLLALVSTNALAGETQANPPVLQAKPGMLLQVDLRSPLLGSASASTTPPVQPVARRGRLELRTSFRRTLDSEFAVEFLGENARPRVEHALLNFQPRPWLQARIGIDKVPMGHELFAVSPSATDFIEHSLVSTNINPGHALGVALHGTLWDERVEYWAGYNVNPPESRKRHDAVARLAFMPERGVSVAASGFWGQREATDTLQWKLATGHTLSEQPLHIQGPYQGVSGEFAAYQGPISFKAEYGLRLETPARGPGRIRTQGMYAAASWVLTGETKTPEGVEPRGPLEPLVDPRGLGAWELAARYGWLWGEVAQADGTGGPRVQELSLGLNWYLSSSVRWMLDMNMFHTEGVPALGDTKLLEVLARAQLAF